MLQFVQGDLQSADLLNYVLTAEDIDTVMHFAAQVIILFTCISFCSPAKSWAIEGMGCCARAMQTHVDNSFGNSLAFTMNNTYGELCFDSPCCSVKKFCSRATDHCRHCRYTRPS